MSDILTINTRVLERFDKEIEEAKQTISLLEKYSINNTKPSQIDSKHDKGMYILDTFELIDNYKASLQNPVMNDKCIREFIDIVKRTIRKRKWFDFDVSYPKLYVRNACDGCNNSDPTRFANDHSGMKICIDCGLMTYFFITDNTPLNYMCATRGTSKFVYTRLVHFQDCIKQFQGKNHCKIPDDVYRKLEQKFIDNNLLVSSSDPGVKYSKITKQHIKLYLKEFKYAKHYKNINLIYKTITNTSNDISDLEPDLISDFKKLVNMYDEIHGIDKNSELNRRYFLNIHYILFQLLRRQGYDCQTEDFTLPKTKDCKLFHDEICGNLFKQLGWDFTPLF